MLRIYIFVRLVGQVERRAKECAVTFRPKEYKEVGTSFSTYDIQGGRSQKVKRTNMNLNRRAFIDRDTWEGCFFGVQH